MKVKYDKYKDTLTIVFSNNRIEESDEDKPGTILDYDNAGNLVSMEILDASKRVIAPSQIDYEVTPA